MIIETNSVGVQLGKTNILKNINLHVQKAELIGLIGPNGAGKSTLIKTIAGLLKYSGDIKVKNTALQNLSSAELSRMIAYLPQLRTIHWNLNCYDIVMLGRLPHRSRYSAPSKQDNEIVKQSMTWMQVEGFSKRLFSQLSGGEQARVLIARLLAQQPDIIIADEPINGLDPLHQIELMHIFRKLVANGKTVICSLHDFSLTSQFCDRVILLNQGTIIADDCAKTVMTQEHIRSVYGVDIMKIPSGEDMIIIPTQIHNAAQTDYSEGK